MRAAAFFADSNQGASVNNTADTAADTGTSSGAISNADADTSSGAGVDADATANAEADDIPQLTDAERAALTAEDLQGVAVYDAADEHVGEIPNIVLSDDDQVEHVIVDVRGFLGLGEKPVAVSFEEIDLSHDQDGVTNALQARTSLTVEELENMQEWEG